MATKTKKTVKSELDYKTIKTFEDACTKLGIDPKQLPDSSGMLAELKKPIIAAYKLMVILKAINNGWTPDWTNSSQWKYYPWFRVLSSGFGFSDSDYYYVYSFTSVGSRLCTDTSEKALYVAKQFEQEYKDFMLIPE